MIDNLIILAYLVVLTCMGYSCRKLSGFKEFAISHASYGWLAVFCALSATFIGGGFQEHCSKQVMTPWEVRKDEALEKGTTSGVQTSIQAWTAEWSLSQKQRPDAELYVLPFFSQRDRITNN